MTKWERRLRKEGLGMSRGRDRRLEYMPEPELAYSQGLVSPLWAMAPSGDNFSEEERNLRARVALKRLVLVHGHADVESRLRGATVPPDAEPVRLRLLSTLATLPE